VRQLVIDSQSRGTTMTNSLNALLEAAKKAQPTPKEREEQRRSFAYGNTAFENERITRKMIDEQAEKLAQEAHERGRKR
jgi:hypothetical protein